jgi:hypothetical protein
VLIADVAKTWAELGDAGEVVAGGAALLVLVTLGLAWQQLRVQVRINRFSVYDALTRLVMDIDRVFIERPEMHKYFYTRHPAPADPTELARAFAIAELLADFMDHVAEHINELEKSAWTEWVEYFVEFRDSDVFTRFMSDHPTWYTPTLRQLFDPPNEEPMKEGETRRLPNEAGITRWRRERRANRGVGQ